MIRVCIVAVTVLVQVFAVDEEHKIVSTDLGNVRGNVLQTLLDNRDFYAFRGIRYAQPPIGELRFKVSLMDRTRLWKSH